MEKRETQREDRFVILCMDDIGELCASRSGFIQNISYYKVYLEYGLQEY